MSCSDAPGGTGADPGHQSTATAAAAPPDFLQQLLAMGSTGAASAGAAPSSVPSMEGMNPVMLQMMQMQQSMQQQLLMLQQQLMSQSSANNTVSIWNNVPSNLF